MRSRNGKRKVKIMEQNIVNTQSIAEPMSRQKKVAAINDLTGYGRCALTVSLPVISHMKLQCCPVPTSILSNHTGYPEYYFDDYTDRLPEYLAMWKKLKLSFDGIMSGFLGSAEQIGMVESFIKTFRKEHTIVVVDPVMGDHGINQQRLYRRNVSVNAQAGISCRYCNTESDRRLQIDGCALPGSWLDAEGVTPDGRTSDGLWTAEGGDYRNSTGRVYREFHV